jgi:hypothetical protein
MIARAPLVARAALVAALALAVAGCPADDPPDNDLILYTLTNAPPASQGSIINSDEQGYSITLTRGVAIGTRCWDSCDYDCVTPQFTIADETLLAVRALWRPTTTDADRVLIAMASGTTTLDVTTACTTRRYTVRILDP